MTIPRRARDIVGLTHGTVAVVEVYEDHVKIRPHDAEETSVIAGENR